MERNGYRTGGARLRKAAAVTGFFVLALGCSVGVITGTTSWASGVSVGSDAQAMTTQVFTAPRTFDASVQTALDALQSSNAADAGTIARFYDAYTSATQDYRTALLSASQIYQETFTSNPAAAKSAYLDNFNAARAAYFNALDSARNIVTSELAGTNSAARDAFVAQYNAARDAFNGELNSVTIELNTLQ